MSDIVKKILKSREICADGIEKFLLPDYCDRNDPNLLPGMDKAVQRLIDAKNKNEKVTIYGDYDIDGITATCLLYDALREFHFNNVSYYLPSRFKTGYGLSRTNLDDIKNSGTSLVVTVDCGSANVDEINYAKNLGMDVIVTDHHSLGLDIPRAVAFVNPKQILINHKDEYNDYYEIKKDSKKNSELYPFLDLAGVGVAFKLVEALQKAGFDGMDKGKEKWLLDLVALGTLCDSVTMRSENRILTYWGLRVMPKTKRSGLKMLIDSAGITADEPVGVDDILYRIGPRMNAAGRIETADYSFKMLISKNKQQTNDLILKLNELNSKRRVEQDLIYKEACKQIEQNFLSDKVIVVAAEGWNCGVIGIVASKLIEKYHKPAYVISIDGEKSKGSARSFGDFNATDALRYCCDYIEKCGGHKFAAGFSLKTSQIDSFRKKINEFYLLRIKSDQNKYLIPSEDIAIDIKDITNELVDELEALEPCGPGNQRPIFKSCNVNVDDCHKMGESGKHVRYTLSDGTGNLLVGVAFNVPQRFFVSYNDKVNIWYRLFYNNWQGKKTIQAEILNLELC